MGKIIDMRGERYGRLIILEQAGLTKGHKARWKCLCDCGNIAFSTRDNLVGGRMLSCGCKRKEQIGKLNKTHGGSGLRLYSIWGNMLSRTTNANVPCYRTYGGRGIQVCDDWACDFTKFRDWALANGYADDLTIDRIDNNKGYSPDNCRWAPWKDQFNNRRRTLSLTYHGETLPIAEWSLRTGLGHALIRRRIYDGWSVERTLTEGAQK